MTKDNFNLRKFLTENKLTANSYAITQEKSGVSERKLNEEGIEDANYKMGEAFKKYGIDLSRDVIVAEMDGGTAGMGGGQVDIGPPEPAMLVAKRLERHRLDTILDYESEDQMRDFPVMYEDGFYGDYTPEGTEHKLTYSEDEGTMWDIFQAPSGVSEEEETVEGNYEKAGTLQVSRGSNAEQEQKVIDIARDAISLMDEQPGTSAESALAAVLDI